MIFAREQAFAFCEEKNYTHVSAHLTQWNLIPAFHLGFLPPPLQCVILHSSQSVRFQNTKFNWCCAGFLSIENLAFREKRAACWNLETMVPVVLWCGRTALTRPSRTTQHHECAPALPSPASQSCSSPPAAGPTGQACLSPDNTKCVTDTYRGICCACCQFVPVEIFACLPRFPLRALFQFLGNFRPSLDEI